MLAGLLNGASFGRNVVDFNKDLATPNNGGHMIFGMRVDCFCPVEDFKRDVDRSICEISTSERMEGVDRICLPGEIEFHTMREGRAHGIPIPPPCSSSSARWPPSCASRPPWSDRAARRRFTSWCGSR